MGKAIKKIEVPGKGLCATPRCGTKKSRGSNFCLPCKHKLKGIKRDLETDPKLLYMQRSDNPNRRFSDGKRARPRRASLPTCCVPGCYELRVPPDPYCDGHQGYGASDD